MKKNSIILLSILCSILTFSQVGINTQDPHSTLVVEGSYEGAYKNITSNTLLTINDQYISVTGSSSIEITLPDCMTPDSFSGRLYNIKNNSSKEIILKGFEGSQLIKIDGETSSSTFTIPAGYDIQIIRNNSSANGTPLWDLSFIGISISSGIRPLTYVRKQVTPINGNTPADSVVKIGSLMVRYNGTTPTDSGYIEYQPLVNSSMTVWYKKAGAGGTGLDKYGQTAAMTGNWYKLSYQTGDTGNNINPNNRDASETIVIMHNTSEVYRITSNVNGDIPSTGGIPAIDSSVTLFVEKLD